MQNSFKVCFHHRNWPRDTQILTLISKKSYSNLTPSTTPKKAPHFYQNRIIDQYALQNTKCITMRQLIVLHKTLDEKKLLQSANYVRHELTVRLAHRIREFQSLPYIVGTNPYFQNVYQLYWNAFNKFREIKEIDSIESNEEFAVVLKEQLEAHVQVIPLLAMGIAECCMMMSQADMDRFIHDMLRTRIGRRLLAHQHLKITKYFRTTMRQNENSHFSNWTSTWTDQLSNSSDNIRSNKYDSQQTPENPLKDGKNGHYGLVCSSVRAYEELQRCISIGKDIIGTLFHREAPAVIIEGEDVEFTYVPEHLEYILAELLTNSMRATIEKHASDQTVPAHYIPPIKVTIASVSNDLYFRISDQGGGIAAHYLKTLYSFSRPPSRFANVNPSSKLPDSIVDNTGLYQKAIHLRLGFGLPMSKVYANYWGGDLNLVSMDGYGTDAYLRISKLGNNVEHLVMD